MKFPTGAKLGNNNYYLFQYQQNVHKYCRHIIIASHLQHQKWSCRFVFVLLLIISHSIDFVLFTYLSIIQSKVHAAINSQVCMPQLILKTGKNAHGIFSMF